jgi:hypothetical protein
MDGQSGLKSLPKSQLRAYEALGNAINVKVAVLVAKALVGQAVPFRNNSQNLTQLQFSAITSSGVLGGI